MLHSQGCGTKGAINILARQLPQTPTHLSTASQRDKDIIRNIQKALSDHIRDPNFPKEINTT